MSYDYIVNSIHFVLFSVSGDLSERVELGIHFTEEPGDVILLRGSPFTLNCSALSSLDDGAPPQVSWLRDGAPLGQDIKHTLLPHGALYLRRVTRKLEGDYQCVATNSAGSIISRKAAVQTAGKCHLSCLIHSA